ncbi:MAG: hypothetical protein WCT08_00875 [Patescibacteria group bacterium]|jgi:hypothetical protein
MKWQTQVVLAITLNIIAGLFVYFATNNLWATIISVAIFVFGIYLLYFLTATYILLRQSGLKRLHSDTPDPTTLLTQYFQESTEIRILAIRGARMLGTDRSLINYVICRLPKGWNGRILILMLDPASTHMIVRANELGHEPNHFALECQNGIRNILELKRSHALNLEIRLYNRRPVIRTIIFDKRALLSYYVGSNGHISKQYQIVDGQNSLYRMTKLLYDEIWDEANPVIDGFGTNNLNEIPIHGK